jgi:hypothetical protein
LHRRFFYANGDSCTTLYCRSGIRGSNNTGFPILPVYRSLRGLMQARPGWAQGLPPAAGCTRLLMGVLWGGLRPPFSNATALTTRPPPHPFRQLAGNSSFLDVVTETKQVFAYALADGATGKLAFVILWR